MATTELYACDTASMTWADARVLRDRLARDAVRCFIHGVARPPDRSVPTETHERRLAQRRKQIEKGKNTASYKFYAATMPREERPVGVVMERCPRTPPPELKCSKRGFDALLGRWRRALHAYCRNHPLYQAESSDAIGSDESHEGDYTTEWENDMNDFVNHASLMTSTSPWASALIVQPLR